MAECFLNNKNEIVSEKEWQGFIQSLKTDRIIDNKDKAKELLKESLTNAIKIRVENSFGLLFSGGIDSTTIALILKQLGYRFTCYCVGLENSKDIESAQEVAKELGLELKTKTLTLEDAEQTIEKVSKILKEPNVVKVGVGCVFYEAMKLAKEDNVKAVFTGLGSEEIFAGYERHANAKDVNKECWHGLLNMWERDLKRDYSISKELNIELRTPLLDKEVIRTAMMIPGKYKISKQHKKLILREVSLEFGLRKEFAFKKKRAAQYGSGFDKAMQKIAKRHGFKFKTDYLRSLI